MYNLLTCGGFTETVGSWIASAPCMKGRIGLVILFFFIAIVRKWGGEEIGLGFNFLFALIFGLVSYFIIITIFGSFKIAFIVGAGAGLVGGYGAGFFMGGDEY